MLETREYTLCSPFRANAHNSSYNLDYSDDVTSVETVETDFVETTKLGG